MVDHQPHFGVEAGGARVKVEGADKHALAVENKGFGVQAGGRAGQAFVFTARGHSLAGLEFVEGNAGFQQAAAVAGVAGMDGGNVGGAQRVGEHGNGNAAPRKAVEQFQPAAAGHEVGADQIHFALGRLHRLLDFVGDIDADAAVKRFVGVVAHQTGVGADVVHPPGIDGLAQRAVGQRLQKGALGGIGGGGNGFRMRVGDDALEGIGRIAVPVAVEILRDFAHHRPGQQHVGIGKGGVGMAAEVGIADVAPADDRHLVVGGERFVVHAPV